MLKRNIIMKKHLFLFCVTAVLALLSCSSGDNDDDNGNGGGDVSGLTEEKIMQKLSGEWICYYQYWEEGGIEPYKEDAYYNTDDLSLTFDEDGTCYLKSEHDDELLEVGRSSSSFTYTVSGQTIHLDGKDYKWIIMSLTDKELTLKRQDGDYIIIAKFTKRASLEGKVSRMSFDTEYNNNTYKSYVTYSFSYDFRGELNGIVRDNSRLTYGTVKDNERYITWYDGKRLKLVDKKKDDYYAEVFLNNTSLAQAKYGKDGYLEALTDGNNSILFKYSNGNMTSMSYSTSEDVFKYEYSKEKNDANIDLNYFTDYFLAYDGYNLSYSNYLELGLDGTKSKNLVSKFVTPEDVDYYLTYSYERDAEGRVSKIIRTCWNRYGKNDWLNKCTIKVEYYDE